jgi:hypothetical protein
VLEVTMLSIGVGVNDVNGQPRPSDGDSGPSVLGVLTINIGSE